MNDRMKRSILTSMIISAIIIFSFFAQVCFADVQSASFTKIDEYARNTPTDAEKDVSSLVKYLIRPTKNDTEKARAIYIWITNKIAYDTDTFFSGNLHNTDPEEVIKTKKTICCSYAALYQKMAQMAGLDVIKIDGAAKGFGYTLGTPIGDAKSHSWNAVRIDGQWKMLDCTWGAGYINEDKKFVYKFREYYFLAKPENFIYTHFPSEAKYQFLKKPLTEQEFVSLPNLRPGFFEDKIEVLDNYNGKIESKGTAILNLASPEDIALQVRLRQSDKKIDDLLTFVQMENGKWKVRATCPSNGIYTLKLFAKNKASKGNYEWVADFMVENNTNNPSPKQFPQMFGAFFTNEVCLYSPMDGILKTNSIENFNVNIPNAESASVIIAGKWMQLKKNGSNFSGDVKIDPGDILLVAKYPQNKSCDVLLKYMSSDGTTVAQNSIK